MIKVDSAISYLEKKKTADTFENIFKAVEEKLPQIHEDANESRAELWNALTASIDIVRIEEEIFDLAKRYSLEELQRIERLNSGVEEIENDKE